MKTLAILLAASLLPATTKADEVKIASATMFFQCGIPLYLILTDSEGTIRVVRMDGTDAVLTLVKQLPSDAKYRIDMPEPENGCPITT